MINLSPLRQLSREYFEGQIDRAYYLRQRQQLIESLAGGQGNQDTSRNDTIPGLIRKLEEAEPDSNDLFSALATRDDDFSTAYESLSDRPEFDRLQTALMDGGVAEVSSEQLAAVQPEQKSAPTSSVSGLNEEGKFREAPSGLSMTGIVLLVLFLVAAWIICQYL